MKIPGLVCSLLALAPSLVLAQQPAAGNWFNSLEDGRGWIIEKQNDVIAVTHFVYDEAGDATFYINSGVWDPVSKSIESELYSFSNGQCLGCAYKEPEFHAIGTVELVFSSSTKGHITYPDGVAIDIEKINYGYESPMDVLEGGWTLSRYDGEGGAFPGYFYFEDEIKDRVYPDGEVGHIMPAILGTNLLLADEWRRKVGSVGAFYLESTYDDRYMITTATPDMSEREYYYAIVEGETIRGSACTTPIDVYEAPPLSSCTGMFFGTRQRITTESP